jgi:septum formation protein
MLRALSGKAHDVVTGVALCRDSELVSGRELTRVIFSTLSDDVVRRYVATGEPDDKAGAYALQGIGGMLVERVEGSPSNVVGLPVRLVRRLALELGIDLL